MNPHAFIEPDSNWTADLAAWTTALTAMRLSPLTIQLRTYHIRRLSRAFAGKSPWTLTGAELVEWVGNHKWSRETSRSIRESLHQFWAWAVKNSRALINIADALPTVRPPQPHSRPASAVVVEKAIKTANVRTRLMLRLANELGMRRAEVAVVNPERDLVRDPAGYSLVVHGKGARNRVLPLPKGLAEALLAAPPGFLFPGQTGGHLSPHWVGTLVSRALGDGTTMHQLRHLCATELSGTVRNLRIVQTLLGHASLATTQRYIAVDDAEVRSAIDARSSRWNT